MLFIPLVFSVQVTLYPKAMEAMLSDPTGQSIVRSMSCTFPLTRNQLTVNQLEWIEAVGPQLAALMEEDATTIEAKENPCDGVLVKRDSDCAAVPKAIYLAAVFIGSTLEVVESSRKMRIAHDFIDVVRLVFASFVVAFTMGILFHKSFEGYFTSCPVAGLFRSRSVRTVTDPIDPLVTDPNEQSNP